MGPDQSATPPPRLVLGGAKSEENSGAISECHGHNLGWLVTDKNAHYIAIVKRNQPLLHAQVRALPWRQVPGGGSTRKRGHGRAETRTLKTAHVSHLDFPHARQAIKITRWRQHTATGKTSRQTVYAVTTLTSAGATAQDLARLIREHWSIEAHHHIRSPGVLNLSHDVALDGSAGSFCNTSRGVWCSLLSLLKSLAPADPPHVQHLVWWRRVVRHGSTRTIREDVPFVPA